MHSSHLRGADFTMTIDGDDTSHADFFHDFAITRRLGVVCDTPLDGLGAATLLMAAVTAFYDGYRDMGGEFFAYPDFFTFQLQSPVASYSMFDIWPDHKNVDVEPEMHTGALTGSLTDAITDRGIDTLILADGWRGGGELKPVQQAALRRTVRSAFAYAPAGTVADADITIHCAREPLVSWAHRVISSIAEVGPDWFAAPGEDLIMQSFRKLSPTDAISRL